jgi:hypothetical protein
MRRIAVTALIAATVASTAGTAGHSAVSESSRVRCPTDVTARTVRPATVDGVIAAARRVVLDHITEDNQGRITRRTPASFPILEVVQLTGFPPLPGSASLKRLAIRRCGTANAYWAWAVVFTDTQSPVCCLREIVFVVRVERGWRVF